MTFSPPNVALFGAQNIFYRIVTTTSCGIINSNGCSNTAQIVPYGIVFNTSGEPSSPVCPGSSFTYHIDGAVFGTIKYSWSADPLYISPSSGGPVGGQIFYSYADIPFTTINSTNAPVTTTVTITPTLGDFFGNPKCNGTAETFDVTINPTPAADQPTNIVVCNGASVPATVFTGNVTASGISYSWTRTVGNKDWLQLTGPIMCLLLPLPILLQHRYLSLSL